MLPAAETSDSLLLVTFALGDALFALDARDLQEVAPPGATS